MLPLLAALRRTLLTPALLPLTLFAMGLTWLGVEMARAGLGADEGLVADVRSACLPFAAALVLSLADPLALRSEAQRGMLRLRAARTGGFALVPRWLGISLATLPTVALCALAGGAFPDDPLGLLLDLSLLCAGGLLLGSLLPRRLLVPALWCLLVAGYLRPYYAQTPVAYLLPGLGAPGDAPRACFALAWSGGALLLARSRLLAATT